MCWRCDDQLVGPHFLCIDNPPEIEFDENGNAIPRVFFVGSVKFEPGWLRRDVEKAAKRVAQWKRGEP